MQRDRHTPVSLDQWEQQQPLFSQVLVSKMERIFTHSVSPKLQMNNQPTPPQKQAEVKS